MNGAIPASLTNTPTFHKRTHLNLSGISIVKAITNKSVAKKHPQTIANKILLPTVIEINLSSNFDI